MGTLDESDFIYFIIEQELQENVRVCLEEKGNGKQNAYQEKQIKVKVPFSSYSNTPTPNRVFHVLLVEFTILSFPSLVKTAPP